MRALLQSSLLAALQLAPYANSLKHMSEAMPPYASTFKRLHSPFVLADSAARAAARLALAAGNAEYIRAFGVGDAAGVAAVYAPDGSRMGQKGAVLTGRDAIRDDVAHFIAHVGPVIVTIDSRELWLVDDMAYESGAWSYTFTPPGKPQTRIAGRFVTSWKRQPGGTWRIYADIALSE